MKRIQKETNELERIQSAEYRGSERIEKIQHNKMNVVLSSEILRPKGGRELLES